MSRVNPENDQFILLFFADRVGYMPYRMQFFAGLPKNFPPATTDGGNPLARPFVRTVTRTRRFYIKEVEKI